MTALPAGPVVTRLWAPQRSCYSVTLSPWEGAEFVEQMLVTWLGPRESLYFLHIWAHSKISP